MSILERFGNPSDQISNRRSSVRIHCIEHRLEGFRGGEGAALLAVRGIAQSARYDRDDPAVLLAGQRAGAYRRVQQGGANSCPRTRTWICQKVTALEQLLAERDEALEYQTATSPRSVSLAAMTTLEDIEKAVTQLPADQLAKFRAWFEEFEAARFDRRIERDAKAGRLDKLAEQALADFRAGRARNL
jgi:hypothetical protein